MKKYYCWVAMSMIFFYSCHFLGAGNNDDKIESLSRLRFGPAYDIKMKGNVAYLSHNKGVEIVNVSNPRKPSRLSRIKLNDGAFDIELVKNSLFMAGDEEGFYIADVQNTSEPKILSNFKGYEGSYKEVVIKDTYAFVGLWGGRVIIMDIRDSINPRELNSLEVGKGLFCMIIINEFLYVGTYDGINVIDIKDVSNLKMIDTDLDNVFAQDMDLKGTFLYVSSHKYGLKILDVAKPLLPELIGVFNDGGEANNSLIVDQALYVSDADTGLIEVLDIQNPKKPKKITEYLDCYPHAVVVRNSILYIATTGKGLHILKIKS